jgi:transcription initiation factor TFIIIB Brf1 subunit/transcription initiation factor TFIIB
VTAARHGYLSGQPELNEKGRATLMEWLTGMCLQFNLKHETLFMAASVIDRFLTQEKLSKSRSQLVGLAALVIAAKYEEIYPPTVTDMQRATDRSLTKAEVLRMEGTILRQLQFDLSGPSVYTFLERYSKLLSASELTFDLALYFAELQLLDYGLLKQLPSLQALAALYLASKLTRPTAPAWNDALQTQSGRSEDDAKTAAKELLTFLQLQDKITTSSARKKYSHKKFLEVSKLKLNLALLL